MAFLTNSICSTNQPISILSGTGAINCGTDAVAKTITIGNVTGATSVVLNAGTGAINIGTSIAKTITMGNTTGATALRFNAGSGSAIFTCSGSDFQVITGTGSVVLGNDNASKNVVLGNSFGSTTTYVLCGTGGLNIGNGAVALTIAMGNTTGATAVNISAGTGGITLNSNSTGKISLVSQTSTAAALSVTNNALIGTSTLTGQTINASTSTTLTLNNSNITTSNAVMLHVSTLNVSGNGGYLTVTGVIQASGSLSIKVTNNGAGNLTSSDTIIIGFMVLG